MFPVRPTAIQEAPRASEHAPKSKTAEHSKKSKPNKVLFARFPFTAGSFGSLWIGINRIRRAGHWIATG